jgi:hypothetical protein
MITALVWLLATTTYVYGGEHLTVYPQAYPTLKDCEQVLNNLPKRYKGGSRCIQTTIVLMK